MISLNKLFSDDTGPARGLLFRITVNLPADEAAPPAVEQWLASRRLLERIPFRYALPRDAMLPPPRGESAGSVRFFYLDRRFLDALVDGALSLTQTDSRSRRMRDALREDLNAAVDRREYGFVKVPLADPPEAPAPAATSGRLKDARGPQKPLSEARYGQNLKAVEERGYAVGGLTAGMLLRSDLVRRWPGLEIEAFSGQTKLPTKRRARLSSTVLLCLWGGVPDRVILRQPAEGLTSGLVRRASGQLCAEVPAQAAGGARVSADAYLRADGREVVQVEDLAARLAAAGLAGLDSGLMGLALSELPYELKILAR